MGLLGGGRFATAFGMWKRWDNPNYGLVKEFKEYQGLMVYPYASFV
jgi:hypothetical protein